LTKAVETCFPQAPTLLCCRHLEENVQRRLQDKVGVPAQVRQDIVRCVFGAEGLAVAGGCFQTPPDVSGRLRTLFSMTAGSLSRSDVVWNLASDPLFSGYVLEVL